MRGIPQIHLVSELYFMEYLAQLVICRAGFWNIGKGKGLDLSFFLSFPSLLLLLFFFFCLSVSVSVTLSIGEENKSLENVVSLFFSGSPLDQYDLRSLFWSSPPHSRQWGFARRMRTAQVLSPEDLASLCPRPVGNSHCPLSQANCCSMWFRAQLKHPLPWRTSSPSVSGTTSHGSRLFLSCRNLLVQLSM